MQLFGFSFICARAKIFICKRRICASVFVSYETNIHTHFVYSWYLFNNICINLSTIWAVRKVSRYTMNKMMMTIIWRKAKHSGAIKRHFFTIKSIHSCELWRRINVCRFSLSFYLFGSLLSNIPNERNFSHSTVWVCVYFDLTFPRDWYD